MKTYIGTKTIKANPMNRQEYNDYRGWELPSGENGNDEGYLVEYLDGGQANHPDHAGYISWSPVNVFKNAYRPISCMTFGDALVMLKQGLKVTRAGWNGKDMFIYYVPENYYPAVRNSNVTMLGEFPDDMVPYGAYLAMKTAQGNVVPWLASQTDVLAEDWAVVQA